MQNVIPIFHHVEIPTSPVDAARKNLPRAVLELICARIEAEDRDTLSLGQEVSIMLNEAKE